MSLLFVRTVCILGIVCLSVRGQDLLVGTWVFNPEQSTVNRSLRITYERYAKAIKCAAAGVEYVALFDGTDYPIKGLSTSATVALRRIDEYTVERTYKRDGATVNTATLTISPDARFLTVTSMRVGEQSTAQSKSISIYKKISAPGEADPLLGTWERHPAKLLGNSLSNIRFERSGDELTHSGDNGEFTASINGREYPVTGTIVADSIAIHRVDAFTTEEVWRSRGRAVATVRRKVSQDGKLMTALSSGTTQRGEAYTSLFVYDKQ